MAKDGLNPSDSVQKTDDKQLIKEESKKAVENIMKLAGVFDRIVPKVQDELDQSVKKLESVSGQDDYREENFKYLFGERSSNQDQLATQQVSDGTSEANKDDILSGFGVQEKAIQTKEESEDDMLLDEITESIFKQLRDDRRIVPNPTRSRKTFAVIKEILNDTDDDASKKNKIEAEVLNVPDSGLQVYAAMLSEILDSAITPEEKAAEINGEDGINAQFSFLEQRIKLSEDASVRNSEMSLEIDNRLSQTIKSCLVRARKNNKEDGDIEADNSARALIDKAMSAAENAYGANKVEKYVQDGMKRHEQEIDNSIAEIAIVKFDPANAAIAFREIKEVADVVIGGDKSRISEISDKALNVADASLQVYAAMLLRVLGSEKGADQKIEEINGENGINEQFSFLGDAVNLDLDAHSEQLAVAAINSSDNHKKISSDDDWDCGRFVKEGIDASVAIDDKKEQDVDVKQQDETSQAEEDDKKENKKKKSFLKNIDKSDLKNIAIQSGRGAIALALICAPIPGGPLLAIGFLIYTSSSDKDIEQDNVKERARDLKRVEKEIDAIYDQGVLDERIVNQEVVDDTIQQDGVDDPKKLLPEYDDLESTHIAGVVDKLSTKETQLLENNQKKLKSSQEELQGIKTGLPKNEIGSDLELEVDSGNLDVTEDNKDPNAQDIGNDEDMKKLLSELQGLSPDAGSDDNKSLPDKEKEEKQIIPGQ